MVIFSTAESLRHTTVQVKNMSDLLLIQFPSIKIGLNQQRSSLSLQNATMLYICPKRIFSAQNIHNQLQNCINNDHFLEYQRSSVLCFCFPLLEGVLVSPSPILSEKFARNQPILVLDQVWKTRRALRHKIECTVDWTILPSPSRNTSPANGCKKHRIYALSV